MAGYERKVRVKEKYEEKIRSYDKNDGGEEGKRHYGEYADKKSFKVTQQGANSKTKEKIYTPDEGEHTFNESELEFIAEEENTERAFPQVSTGMD